MPLDIHLQRQVSNLNEHLSAMGSEAEKSFEEACKALKSGDIGLAIRVQNYSRRMNETEAEMKEDCLNILAINPPVDVNLRVVINLYKMINRLERIGKYSAMVAKFASTLSLNEWLEISVKLHLMFTETRKMVKDYIVALTNSDITSAKKVLNRFSTVKKLGMEIIKKISLQIENTPGKISSLLYIIAIPGNIEEIAGSIEKIAEGFLREQSLKHYSFSERYCSIYSKKNIGNNFCN